MNKEKIWTKDFIALTLGNFSSAIVFYFLMTSIAVFATSQFHTSQKMAGLAVSIFLIGGLASRLIAGKYMDSFGRKKTLMIAQVFNILVMVAYFFVNSIELLIVVRILHGFSFGFNSTVFLTGAMATLPVHRRGEGNGYFSMSVAASMALGPLLALQLVNHFGYRVLFTGCLIFTGLSLLCTIIAHIVEANSLPDNPEHTSGSTSKKEFFLWTMIDKNSLPVALIMLPGGIAISGILSFTNAYTSQIGLSEVASVYFIVYAVFLFFSRPAAGRLYDRKGENIVLVPAIAVFALCYCFMAVSKGPALLLVAAGLLAFGYGTMMSVIQTIAVRLAPDQHMGMAISTFYICLDVGTGIGGYIIGWLVDGVGFRSMYLIIACLLLAMIPVYWLVHGRTVRRRK